MSFPAIGVTENGPISNLSLLQLAPSTLLPHDLLIRIKAVASNPVDGMKRSFALWGPPPSKEQPYVMGYDGSGVVEEVGSEVTLYKKGDEVFFAGDITRFGSLAQFLAIDERIVGTKPKSLNFAESAALPLTGLTAWEAFEESMDLKPVSLEKPSNVLTPKRLLIVGGAGGVGSIAIQLAKTVFGVQTVIATASRPETKAYCLELGADFVINHYNNLKKELDEIKIDGIDLALVATPLKNDLFVNLSGSLTPFGRIVGLSLGGDKLDFFPIFAKRGSLIMELMFTRSMFKIDMQKQKKILDEIARLVDEGRIKSTMKRKENFSLEAVKQSQENHSQWINLGKFVLDDVDEYFSNLKI